ncbi:MAG: hypothetical protein HKO95_17220 [Rhodobacteraceae bacterium]|nr:hypothetical protein [Paracoccaceae bacterium]
MIAKVSPQWPGMTGNPSGLIVWSTPMPDANMQDFYRRMDRITRHHRKLSQGYVTTMNEDGLIVAEPRTLRRIVPWRSLLFTLFVVMAFKGWLFASIGPAAYEARVISLQNGSLVMQAGAYVMTADPVTLWIATLFGHTGG